jgi:hypothetical protein
VDQSAETSAANNRQPLKTLLVARFSNLVADTTLSIGVLFAIMQPEPYIKPGLFEQLPGPRKRLIGFTKDFLRELGAAGLIRLVKVRRPGNRRPLELVHVPSLIAYVEQEEAIAAQVQLAQHRQAYAGNLLEVFQEDIK